MRIKDYKFEMTKYNRSDFEGYKGEINVSIKLLNTNYFITGRKYVRRLETLKELKEWLKNNEFIIQTELTNQPIK